MMLDTPSHRVAALEHKFDELQLKVRDSLTDVITSYTAHIQCNWSAGSNSKMQVMKYVMHPVQNHDNREGHTDNAKDFS